MASLTMEGVPKWLMERLRERAREDRRTLTEEALALLERALTDPPPGVAAEQPFSPEDQIRSWSELAGRWEHEGDVEDLVAEIYGRRSGGREVAL